MRALQRACAEGVSPQSEVYFRRSRSGCRPAERAWEDAARGIPLSQAMINGHGSGHGFVHIAGCQSRLEARFAARRGLEKTNLTGEPFALVGPRRANS